MGSPIKPTSASSLSCSVEPRLLAGQPPLGEPRRLMGGAGEALVAAPARAAAGHHGALSGAHEVVARAVAARPPPRSRAGPRSSSVCAVGAVAQRPLAVAAAAGLEVRAAAVGLEVAQRVVADQDDVAAAAAVAAVGAALGHVGLAAEAEAAVAAAAGLNVDSRAIVHACRSDMADPVFLITGASSGHRRRHRARRRRGRLPRWCSPRARWTASASWPPSSAARSGPGASLRRHRVG